MHLGIDDAEQGRLADLLKNGEISTLGLLLLLLLLLQAGCMEQW